VNPSFQHFGIVGGGAWGTALALSVLRAGRNATLWVYERDVADSINRQHENKIYLPGVLLDQRLKATSNLADLATCHVWILASPAQHVRGIARQLGQCATNNKTPVIIAAKGIEQKTSLLLSDVVTAEMSSHPVSILSGPTFAIEVARAQPAALTLAIKDKILGDQLMQAMVMPSFRLYLTDDIVGAQIGGAIKNVLAVACGIIEGRKMGKNACAALITRGLAEMTRLGMAMGGRAETLMGLSGLGDLVLTCSSVQSRNMSLGVALGQGEPLAKILAARSSVTEGVYTAAAALALAQKHKVEMPIVTAVDAVLNRDLDIDTTIAGLLSRPLRDETYDQRQV
jgi:glycerol-3-phosphate dehydrogenase (NAD(P)+)